MLTPLTGRDTELGLLKDRWEQAQERLGQVVLIVGEPGLGKSRLVQTLTRLVDGQAAGEASLAAARRIASTPVSGNPPVIAWRCSQPFQNSELHPVSDYLQRFLGFGQDQSSTARLDCLSRHLQEHGLPRPEFVALFAKLLFLPPGERYPATGLTPAREREETFRVLRRWLRACCEKRPVLFVVEDLHWADASTLEFLGQLLGEGRHDRLLTVLTCRPEFNAPWPPLAHQTTLALNPLTRRHVAEWLRRDAGEAVPEGLVAQIYERTGGVPLLVEEFTRMARESAVFELGYNASMSGVDSARAMPETLQGLVMARLDRLSINREVAQLAATLGGEFDYELLAAIVSVDEPTLRAELAKLVAAGVLHVRGQPPQCTYFFKHALLEEALHGAIEGPKRRQFHRQVAQALEARFPVSAETQPELLAQHCTEAGLIEKAAGYCLKAGLRARDRFAHVEAISHLTQGLQLLATLDAAPERDARELELLGLLGTTYIASRGYAAPEVGPVFRRARKLCERVGQMPQLFATMRGTFAFHMVRGDLRVCTGLAEEAVAFGQRLDDPGLLMEALFLRGVTRFYRGDFAGARDDCGRAITEFDERERTAFWAALLGQNAGVTHRCYLALALWHLGFTDQALQLNREMLELARSLNHPFSLEYGLHHTGWLCQHCRLGPQVQAAGEEQIQIAMEQGFGFWHASGALYAAAGLLLQGRLSQGLRLLQTGLEAYRAAGAKLALPYYLGVLADAQMQAGRFAEAHAALSEALALVEKNDERFQEAELHRLQGELLLAESDDQTAAEACFRRALETARRQQGKAWELRATTSLARLWQRQGRRQDAFATLSRVHGAFTEGFTTPDLVDAAALLENLRAERMRADFAAGLQYVRACIPAPMAGPVSVDWRYLPAATLGGDTLGYHWVDDEHLALYLIDVTGHGLDSALLSVSVTNVIRAGTLPGTDMRQPDQVLAKLNEAFPGQQHGQKYFTIWYGVYRSATRTLAWAGGGHPPSVVLVPGEPKPRLLPSAGPMMGVLRGVEFPAQSCPIPAGARLLIFSDGVFELYREGRVVWGLTACIAHLATLGNREGGLLDELLNHVRQLRGSPHLDDDFSIIEACFL